MPIGIGLSFLRVNFHADKARQQRGVGGGWVGHLPDRPNPSISAKGSTPLSCAWGGGGHTERTRAAAPSAMTKPSRFASNGREADWAAAAKEEESPLQPDRARMREKAANTQGSSGASVAPANIMSASPYCTKREKNTGSN